MKLPAFLISLCVLVMTLSAPVHTYASDQVNIEDPALEHAIREELKLTDDQPLDYEALQNLTSLYPKGGDKIKSLKGLETAYHLKDLILPSQEITDVTPLQNLYQLQFLVLSNNRIENICALSGLTDLHKLLIDNNDIEDIGCLYRMTSLTDLLADHNRIQDISALKRSKITWLNVEENLLSDVTAAASMKELRTMYVDEDGLNEQSRIVLKQLAQSGVTLNQAPDYTNPVSGMVVMVGEDRLLFDQAPMMESGTTLVQFRPLFEKLGFAIAWDNETKTIQASKAGTSIALQVGSTKAKLNGSTYELPVAPQNVEGNMMIPVRFVGEASKYDVTWDQRTKTIYLMPEHRVLSRDGIAELTVSGKWLEKDFPANADSSPFNMYLVNGSNAVLVGADKKAYLPKIQSLADYQAVIKKTLEAQGISKFSEDRMMTINGLEAVQFSYTANTPNGHTLTVVRTIINGTYNYFNVSLAAGDLVLSEVNEDYQKIVKTFQQIKTLPQSGKEKFGAMEPQDRFMDATHYYRKAGYFQGDAKLTDKQFDEKALKYYEDRFKNEEWNPFGSQNVYNDAADLYALQQDGDRVWMEDTESDVGSGNESYVQALKKWSAISRGAFKPTDIQEKWDSEEGPVSVSFMLNGHKRTIHPMYMDDFLDTDVIQEINTMIEDSGYQFVEVNIDQEVFITVLTAEEKQNIQQERFLDFVVWK